MDECNFDDSQWIKSKDRNHIYYTKEDGERLGFTGFPDYSDKYKLTYYGTNKKDHSILGIHVNDRFEKGDSVLRSYDYNQIDESFGNVEYSKGKVRITLYTQLNEYDKAIITDISINLIYTDKYHKDIRK